MPDTPPEDWETGKCGLKRIRTPHAHLVGSWAGDRIVIAGDYDDNLPSQEQNLYYIAQKEKCGVDAPAVANRGSWRTQLHIYEHCQHRDKREPESSV